MAKPISQRPRERLIRVGPEALSDAELFALVLGTGPKGALAMAEELVAAFPDLRRMAKAGVWELRNVLGIGTAQACRVKAALALASRLNERPYLRGDPMMGPEDIWERIGRRLIVQEREIFLAVLMDVKHRVIAEYKIADGGVCSVEVVPRDVFAAVLREASAAVVFIHNHPSGDPAPSKADELLTRRLTAAGEVVGVRVVDHVIVGQRGYHSFSEGVTHYRDR
jgi:DNA repair protein RadC